MVFFWKKDTSKEILSRLSRISSKVKRLDDPSEKEAEIFALIRFILDNINTVKKEIIARSIEEKSKATIDVKFDKNIDKLADNEIMMLRKLELDMKEFEALARESEEWEELAYLLKQEAEEIKAREKIHEDTINSYQKTTLDARMKTLSYSPSNLKTSDRVPWKNVIKVARELGGRAEKAQGAHQCKIWFPNASRPITLSEDVSSGVLAGKFRNQLGFLSKHKIPTRHQLKKAFSSGGLKAA